MEIHASELETISMLAKERCIATKFLLEVSEIGILRFGKSLSTPCPSREAQRENRKLGRQNVFPLFF